ncbi:MAG: LamG domain-containing protein [Candidatus Entotheonellia bacterium]
MVGQAFSFNGTDAAVDTLPTNIMNFLPLTIEAWIQPALRTDDTALVPNNAVSNDQSQLAGHGFGVNVYATNSRLDIEYQDGFRQVSGTSFADGQWYHVAVVYTAGNFKAYVNGQVVDDFSFTQGALDGGQLVRLGKHNDDVATYGTERFFKGLLDEVAIYNRALAAEEIAAVYNAGSAGKCKAIVGGVGGSVTGLKPTRLLCRNLTTHQNVMIKDQQISWNCEAAGLVVTPGDELAIIIMGGAE